VPAGLRGGDGAWEGVRSSQDPQDSAEWVPSGADGRAAAKCAPRIGPMDLWYSYAMSTLFICRGLPGSGKTTYARDAVTKAPAGSLVRVNRDDLRRMLFGPGYRKPHPDLEVEVTHAEQTVIMNFLTSGTDVICDDTNLRDQDVMALEEIAEQCGDHVEILDLFLQVSVDVCIQRDAQRSPPEQVGADVIRDMWQRYIDQLVSW
jgi:predicted kinase